MYRLRKPRSIRSILFLTYSTIIIIGIAILFVLFYSWAHNLLRTKALSSISELSGTLQKQMDSEIQKLDSVSVSILYSNLITDRISVYDEPSVDPSSPHSSDRGVNNINKPNTDLYDILVALVGPSYPVQQVYLHLNSGVSVGVGFDNSRKKTEIANEPWYETVNNNKKTKPFSLFLTNDRSLNPKVSVSLFRFFSDKYNAPKGIVEVKQSFNKVFSGVIQQAKNNPSLEKIIIYSEEGEIIFPLESAKEDQQFVDDILNNPINHFSADHRTYIADSAKKDKVLLTIKHSDFTNWNIAVMISNKTLLSPLNKFTRLAIAATLIILAFLILLSFLASKKITHPLNKLNKTIKSISLETLISGNAVELNSGMNEWDKLNFSFLKMNTRLKESFDQLLLSRTQELQSKMTALQSQMNPHFLYNSLATISAMAYERTYEEIIVMCESLSDMMRYIAADESSMVDIQTEINYTEMYLTCMKLRYGNMISCTIEVDASIRGYKIPKLMIQPLVENAIKYSTKISPPWNITIRGSIGQNRWIIEVIDNGPGFDEHELSRFYEKVNEMEQLNVLPALKLHGMGLLNIYTRLKLHYGNLMHFDIRNMPDHGAKVTIGGPLKL
ncbi:sensor histidine kinase [Cohnella lupini]|uniref:Two-component system sensor histidine kinase YesM n=1 Tax=Cohnella lupini TaxID=1294267 RepID=A0A3D9IK33_9BACL|nr:histidine kinase [Cohnella lupini]RED61879.1 two-component system sensor histidine kinase YesM [Cohnella lupini]